MNRWKSTVVLRTLLPLAIIILTLTSLLGPAVQPAAAQEGDGLKRQVNASTGRLAFLLPEKGTSLPVEKALGLQRSAAPADPALALAQRYAPEFGIQDPARELAQIKSSRQADGGIVTRYQQLHQGVPVMGGELIVNTDEYGDLYSMNGEVSAKLAVDVQPAIKAEQALLTARGAIAKQYNLEPRNLQLSVPELWVYDPGMLSSDTRPAELVWRMEVTSGSELVPLRELVLVNASRGSLSLHFNQVDTAWSRPAGTPASSSSTSASVQPRRDAIALPIIRTFTMNNSGNKALLPGTFRCNASSPLCTGGLDPHADAAQAHAIGVFNFYYDHFGRDSINNAHMAITSSVHFGSGYNNAFWNGFQMVYGDGGGWPLADDVVGHELTHGVTQYESNLFYYYESGAISESLSDLWGEYYDQENGTGSDGPGYDWLIGEDVTGVGALRSMSDPTIYGDPDSMLSYLYWFSPSDDDNGGVHTNSGVNNKAVYLMVHGGTHNYFTTAGIGWEKTAAIYYDAATNLLTSGADYRDLYFAVQQACARQTGKKGITSADCVEVKHALDAVYMYDGNWGDVRIDPPLCNTSAAPVTSIFFDGLEAGTGNWTFYNGTRLRWQLDSPYGQYAQAGQHFLYADDWPAQVTDARAQLKPILIPANAFMSFTHAYDLEHAWDGGVVEYSINNGLTWVDAGPLMLMQEWGYNSAIYSYSGSPLHGRSAFSGYSGGYITTRMNLASLAGKTVLFRWRMGLDESFYTWGWWLDNVRIYKCEGPGNFNKGSIGDGAAGISLNPVISWSASPGATYYQYCIDQFDDDRCNSSWSAKTTSLSAQLNNLGAGADYYWQVRAGSSKGLLGADSDNWWTFQTTGSVPAGTGAVDVTLGGVLHGSYTLAPSTALRTAYASANGGPLQVQSTNGIPLVASMRVNFPANATYSSYSEFMGIPAGKLSDAYLFPWYNNSATGGVSSQLRIANVGSAETYVSVIIGGVLQHEPYYLLPSQSLRLSYYNLDRGPVRIESTNRVPVIASMRINLKTTPGISSYSEFLGLPASSTASTRYVFPWYSNLASGSMQTQLRFGNVGSAPTWVTVTIGGAPQASYLLDPDQSERVSFADVDAGPVVVESSDGVPIIAAMRVNMKTTPGVASYTEFLGQPGAAPTDTKFVFPWYNNLTAGGLQSQLRFANIGSSPTNVTVTIGGVLQDTYYLEANESKRVVYTNLDNGPVEVESDGQPIVASIRIQMKKVAGYSSYTELMGLSVGNPLGLPGDQLSSTYWFPVYDNLAVSSQMRFGVP